MRVITAFIRQRTFFVYFFTDIVYFTNLQTIL